MALNVFGNPISSLITHKRIMKNESAEDKAHHSCGIWPQASYINHSCTASARRSFIGDMIIVRATRDMEPGEEVTFWYQVPHYDENMRDKLKSWGFECDCTICQDAKKTKAVVKKERMKLRELLKKESKASASPGAAMECLIKKMEATYTTSPDLVPRLSLWDVQLRVAQLYMQQGKLDQAFKAGCKVFTLLGFEVVESKDDFEIKKWGMLFDSLIDAFFVISDVLLKLNAYKGARKADEYAKTVYKMVVGEDESFEKTYRGPKV